MRAFFLIVFVCSFFSCQKKGVDLWLEDGLEGYRKIRKVDKSFVPGYGIDKIGFFRIEDNEVQLAVKLKDDADIETINNFSLGIYAYIDNKYISHKEGELNWEVHPKIHEINNFNYILDTITVSATMDSLVFYLFDRDRYKGILGDRIIIKNLAP